MKARLGETCAGSFQALRYGETIALGGVTRAAGAGGAHPRQRAGGDRARAAAAPWSPATTSAAPIPTAAPFELVRCDLFVTEATFGLPVFRHEPDAREIGRLLASLARLPERTHRHRRLRPRQGPAADRAAARGRLRPADLAARRAEDHVRPLRRRSASTSATLALVQRRARQAAGRDRAVPAVRAEGPLVAAADRSRHGLRLGLDARARPRPPARRRAAAGHLRPLRLARADPDHRRDAGPRRCGSRTAARTRWCIRSA